MSAIGGPGGIGGPKGPSGPSGPDAAEDISEAHADIVVARAKRATGELEAMAGDIAAGKLTAREAIDRLVDEICGTEQLAGNERAELREMLTELVANDPYLQSLVGRV